MRQEGNSRSRSTLDGPPLLGCKHAGVKVYGPMLTLTQGERATITVSLCFVVRLFECKSFGDNVYRLMLTLV